MKNRYKIVITFGNNVWEYQATLYYRHKIWLLEYWWPVSHSGKNIDAAIISVTKWQRSFCIPPELIIDKTVDDMIKYHEP